MGRFDWSWDASNPPKLLEYNADTPSMILESSVIQGDWQKQKLPRDGQSNYLEDALDRSMVRIKEVCQGNPIGTEFWNQKSAKVGFIVVDHDDESAAQMLFLQGIYNRTTFIGRG